MGAFILKLRTWWETADRTQRSVTIFGSAFLAILLLGTFYFASRPKLIPLYAGMSPSERGMVAAELQKLGVMPSYDNAGNLLVPESRAKEIEDVLAREGKAPMSANISQSDQQKLGAMDTPAAEREKIRASLEQRLAGTIKTMSGVREASVSISMGATNMFVGDEESNTTAAVKLTEAASGSISGEMGKTIAQLVANAVPKLRLSSVLVATNDGRALFNGNQLDSGTNIAADAIRTNNQEADRQERELQAVLDQTFGSDATRLTLRLELDLDASKVTSTKPEVSENPVKVQGAKENMKAGGSSPSVSGVGAAGAPIEGGTAGGGSGSGDDYKGDKTEKIFAEGRTMTETVKALGTVKALAISVLTNETKKIDPAAVEKYLRGYLGPKADDPNFTVTVTAATFDTSAATKVTADIAASKSAAQMQQIFSLVPIIALFVVGFMVIKAIGKTAKGNQNVLVSALPGGGMGPNLGGLTLTQGGVGSIFTDEEEEEVEETVMEGDKPVQVKRKKKKKRPVIEEEEDEEIGKIRQRLNLPLEQIKRLSNEKPETVAMLIKSWLLEEKK